ncbi:sulfatase [Coraliomargarita sp. W4R72]
MKRILQTTALTVSLLVTAITNAHAERPNFVLILADDLGWSDVGFNGSSFHRTPNIDALAAEGLVFDHGYSAGPVCSPTRASLLSGQTTARNKFSAIHYPPYHGRPLGPGSPSNWPDFIRLIEPNTVTAIPTDWTTLPEVLSEAGYRTGSFGKWHLGPFHHKSGEPNSDPEDHGFDVAEGWGSAGSSYMPPWHVENLRPTNDQEYLTDALTNAAIRFIDEDSEKPFFLYLPHFAVHSPWMAVADDVALFAEEADPRNAQHNAVYAAMIKRMDDSVGQMRAALEARGLSDNTIIIFTSDNGPVPEDYRGVNDNDRRLDHFKPGQKITSAAPFRGEKGTLFEGGIRVPWIIYAPGMAAAGNRTNTPIITYDLFPTLLDLAGITSPKETLLDGRSIAPTLSGTAIPERPLYWHYPHYVGTPPSEKYPDGMKQRPASAIRLGQWKLIHDYENDNDSLFDLSTDPGEMHDLISWRPDTAARLRNRLLNYLLEVDAQIPLPNPNNALQNRVEAVETRLQ